jgi:DNA-directed RNA polymerase subunit RPC12/RpoP
MTLTDLLTLPDFYTCPDCGTRIRVGQMHSTGNRKNVKAHQVLTIVRAPGLEDPQEGHQLLYDPKPPKRTAPRRIPAGMLVYSEDRQCWVVSE